MKNTLLILSLIITLAACNQPPPTAYGAPVTPAAAILKDGMTCWNYLYPLPILDECVTLNATGGDITKRVFLDSLATGNYLPLRLTSNDSSVYYQLYPLNDSVAGSTKSLVKNWAANHLKHYNMMGKPLPPFRFVDLKGNEYTNESVKGKVLVLKCWFVACKPCVAEMPELNEVVAQNAGNKDVLFVSLATDDAAALQAFLQKTAFHYETVPAQQGYIDSLGIRAYPTHLLVNKKGIVTMVAGRWADMKQAFEKAATGL